MQLNVAGELAQLKRMSTRDLRSRYAEVFGEGTNANNKPWLIKRIAWRLHALAEGDLTERARRRAEELACDADIRQNPPRTETVYRPADEELTTTRTIPFKADDRLPAAGTILARPYKGETLQVRVLADGFEFEGQVYGTLSVVAKAITGTHTNGFLFFRAALNGRASKVD
jgi:hypothetical protein